jgi:hypothetical protein
MGNIEIALYLNNLASDSVGLYGPVLTQLIRNLLDCYSEIQVC